ncbi:S41 family peptidase [Flavobacterium taihuense]|uniref:PDZ domain-containing protein n=1 Tax=Flavobacterium taihuense TaxID=2857508 RepID=A0ABS6XRN3_9FLAO|nr:S41 family peptidase [Flavobacterium taihuense]MBW4359327.1 PDZ domain-containing protein [Flavobacterium taihuense]
MKKIILYLLIVFSQTISGQVKLFENQKLAATCKVWGYLKYYHPKVANGDFNWDNKLFEVLPQVEKAQTKEEFSLVLEKWIDALGEVKEIIPIIPSKEIEYFDKNFDLSWISNNELFSKKLFAKLKFIENNRFQGQQHYVESDYAENIFLKNENFDNLNYIDKNSRILVLFMYWNVMEYFFPYKYLMDQKWDTTLEEMLPVFIQAKNEGDFYIAMQKLTVKLNDTHAVFYKYNSENLYYFPTNCKIIDEKLVVTEILADSLAETDDIKIGDVITKINNKTIKEIILENRDLIGGSNESVYLRNIVEPILSGDSDTVKIEFLKDSKNTTRTINLHNYHDSHKNKYVKGRIKKEKIKILENNIGYVDMGILYVKNIPEMIENLKSTNAIIFDMRNYPNGTYDEISKFLNSKEKEYIIYTKPDLSYPGRYKWSKPRFCGSENKNNYKGKVVVLLNEESLSQSEQTAMCFQTGDNTTIIGSQTAGADGNVSNFEVIKGVFTRFTGIGVYYPDKRETQRIGIIPDIEIKPTILGIQQGKDEVLDRAIQFIETGK